MFYGVGIGQKIYGGIVIKETKVTYRVFLTGIHVASGQEVPLIDDFRIGDEYFQRTIDGYEKAVDGEGVFNLVEQTENIYKSISIDTSAYSKLRLVMKKVEPNG